MIFKGEKPINHRKLPGKAKCECGAELTICCGEWIHPEINKDSTDEFFNSIKDMTIIDKGDYKYFIHPLADGIPALTPSLLREAGQLMLSKIDKEKLSSVTKIFTVEAMGIPLGIEMMKILDLPLVIGRKRTYMLPDEIAVNTSTGYSASELYINNIFTEDTVIIVDDVISTGGTLSSILRVLPCKVSQIIILFEKGNGKQKIIDMGYDIQTVHKIEL